MAYHVLEFPSQLSVLTLRAHQFARLRHHGVSLSDSALNYFLVMIDGPRKKWEQAIRYCGIVR